VVFTHRLEGIGQGVASRRGRADERNVATAAVDDLAVDVNDGEGSAIAEGDWRAPSMLVREQGRIASGGRFYSFWDLVVEGELVHKAELFCAVGVEGALGHALAHLRE